ncbi:unnamed protein product, partial [Soboliphyme baturini]|uniref:Glutamine amidotransferase type-2 domain-containing protein n=1 Tax=Soboliphyme baturini TaxID=241478 RepID=A0A183J9L7_9BILA
IAGIGHTRYSTAGLKNSINCVQPFVVYTNAGVVAVAHNGELVKAEAIRSKVLKSGVGLSTDTDSELIAQFIASADELPDGSPSSWISRIRYMMKNVTCSYSLIVMVRDRIFAVRDPWGNRPLCIGTLRDGDKTSAWFVSSESCAFPAVGATLLRTVHPGEIVELTSSGIGESILVERPSTQPAVFCIFEYIYFSRADSVLEDQQVYRVRFRCGEQLALESPVDAEIVSTVPTSAIPAALGYSKQVSN